MHKFRNLIFIIIILASAKLIAMEKESEKSDITGPVNSLLIDQNQDSSSEEEGDVDSEQELIKKRMALKKDLIKLIDQRIDAKFAHKSRQKAKLKQSKKKASYFTDTILPYAKEHPAALVLSFIALFMLYNAFTFKPFGLEDYEDDFID